MLALAWLVLLHLWAAFAVHVLPLARPSPWGEAATPYFARYDSGWYFSIARDGYGPPPPPGTESAHAFFPLYPMLARCIHLLTGLDALWALTAVSWITFVFALPLFGEGCRARQGPPAVSPPLSPGFLLRGRIYRIALLPAPAPRLPADPHGASSGGDPRRPVARPDPRPGRRRRPRARAQVRSSPQRPENP